METITNTSDNIITNSYKEYHQVILTYITYRITHRYEAEDLAQEVFVRLLDYKQMLRPDTVKYFLFAIARNIVTDYIRRYYKKQEIDSYMYDSAVTSSNETEEAIIADDLASAEQRRLAIFPEQRRIVYTLSRYGDKTSTEIAEALQLSRRTVENHLFIGRREMREFFRKCIFRYEVREYVVLVFNLIYIIYNPLCLWKKNQNLGRDILMPHQILENKK